MNSTLTARPTHITMPPSPFSSINMAYTPSPSHRLEDPFESPMFSPLIFYTAPSTPIVESPASQAPPQFQGQDPNSPPLTPVTHIAIPHVLPPSSQSPFSLHTPPNESLDDTTLDDEGLSTLERIYLYSRSKSSFHRVFIASALPELLKQVTPHEAIEYVLPLLNTLAMDDDEMVKEAFSSKLVTIIWWFFTRCQLTPGDIVDEDSLNPPEFHDHEGIPTISVQAFTPILGTLLLSPNVLVGGATRYAVVALLGRIKRVNAMESKPGSDSPKTHNLSIGSLAEFDEEEEIVIGFFGQTERSLFQKEILFQVVVGMGRLDSDEPEGEFAEERDQHTIGSTPSDSGTAWQTHTRRTDLEPQIDILAISQVDAKPILQTNNPYFPPLPSSGFTQIKVMSSGSPMSTSSSGSSSSTPSSTTDTSASGSESSFSPHSNISPRITLSSHSPNSSSTDLSMSSPSIISDVPSYDELDEEGEYDQATIGRLSSMSLVAAVAASGYLDDQSTDIFVSEVARVSQDPVYWVRREACFALGALAKIVPAEVVQLTLLRTLQTLVVDPVHHVRHSSLFALPTILGRLPLNQRRQMALDIIIPMSMDESADVRAGVLEALGEVIYTFHEEDKLKMDHNFTDTEMKESQTPPEELLKMFLGRTQDRRIIDGQQPLAFEEEEQVKPVRRIVDKQEASEAFYTDPTRPLICAFNFPAVALTVGRTRWASTLRDTYLWLAESSIPGVKRTLAASLGEMAKIIGEDYAQQDLLPVWGNAFRVPEDDVRLKLIDCLAPFIVALPRNGQLEVFNALLDAWSSGAFTSWREREGIAKSLNDLLSIGGLEVTQVVANLLMYALVDTVNTVREAAIANVRFMAILPTYDRNFLDGLRSDFLAMARSEISRRRMTYIACQQVLLLPRSEGGDPPMKIDDELCRTLSSLASDHIVGVRIGVARVIGFIIDQLRKNAQPVPASILDVMHVLIQDSSNEVRSYVADCLVEAPPKGNLNSGSYQEITKPRSVSAAATALTFSRPPPARKMLSLAS
ncbi:armadillo-type protein [Lentinula edodes]|nr:armadillo-type protein [Lentinula edodes]